MTTEEFNPEKPPKICPECNRKGVKKKVKQFYINLDEEVYNGKHGIIFAKLFDFQGVFMCEEVTCPWPFNMKTPENFVVSMKSNK